MSAKQRSIKNSYKVLIITGPTASGKTQLSEMIAATFPCEIINADVGQFYKPLCIGTAKPDLSTVSYSHHLFDLLDTPQDLSVIKYQELVVELVKDIHNRGKVPVIVGGSQFYIKSLFFPPQKLLQRELMENSEKITADLNADNLDAMDLQVAWDLLHKVDPERARVLHPNDVYRVKRALQIWQKTGLKPSELRPEMLAKFNALIVCVQPDQEILKTRINQRTIQMIEKSGWVQEAEVLINTEWEPFLRTKGLIGYPEIFDWIRGGKRRDELHDLIEKIQIQTVQYAKRQRTFWKSFERELLKASPKSDFLIQTMLVERPMGGISNEQILEQVLTAFNNMNIVYK